jgi:hypothetical protein
MSDVPTNDEREAMIAGDRAGALEPDEAAELPLLADLLGDPSTWAEPSAGLEDMIVGAVTAAEPDTTTSATSIAAGAPPAAAAAPRPRRLVAALTAVAAAIAIVVVATVLVTRGGSGPDYEAQLAATELAPGAHASADISHTDAGFRVTLDARGLPGLQADEYYQAWLKNAADTLVPIGSFSSSDDTVTLWSGVSPEDFPTITVTVEATDGDQTSSGRRVLVGRVRAG